MEREDWMTINALAQFCQLDTDNYAINKLQQYAWDQLHIYADSISRDIEKE